MLVAIVALAACSSDGSAAPTQADGGDPEDSVVVDAVTTTEPGSAPGENTAPAVEGEAAASSEAAEASSVPAETIVGDATQVVEVAVQEILDPVTLDESVATDDAVVISITETNRIDVEARMPGEIGGPALLVVVDITNSGPTPVDLSGVTVNVFDAAGGASTPLTGAPASPILGVLAAGDSAQGRYVFSFDPDRPQPVTVEASQSVDQPIARFVGDIS